MSTSYVIGQTVVVELADDGTVTFTVDLSDVARPRDVADNVDWEWERVVTVAETVDSAIRDGRYAVRADR